MGEGTLQAIFSPRVLCVLRMCVLLLREGSDVGASARRGREGSAFAFSQAVLLALQVH